MTWKLYKLSTIISILIFATIGIQCNSKNKSHSDYSELIKNTINYASEKKNYKSKYNFNVDSIARFINIYKLRDPDTLISEEILKPVILFSFNPFNDQLSLDIHFNQHCLDKNYQSFNYDSLKTIIVIEKENIVNDIFSEKNPDKLIGFSTRIDTKVYFLNKKSLGVYKTITITGDEPIIIKSKSSANFIIKQSPLLHNIEDIKNTIKEIVR